MRRWLERGLALVIGGLAVIGIFGPSLSASGQIPPPPTRPPFPTFPSIPPPPTMPPPTRPPFTFTVPSFTVPPPTMPPQTTTPPPTMPPPTQAPPTLPSSAEQAIEDVISTLEEFGDVFADVIDELEALLETF